MRALAITLLVIFSIYVLLAVVFSLWGRDDNKGSYAIGLIVGVLVLVFCGLFIAGIR